MIVTLPIDKPARNIVANDAPGCGVVGCSNCLARTIPKYFRAGLELFTPIAVALRRPGSKVAPSERP